MRSLAAYLYEGEKYKCPAVEKAPWCHIDLFYYRETSQNTLKKYIKAFPTFFNNQLAITKRLICWLKPEYILIANAYAGEVFREMFYPMAKLNLEVKFNNKTLSNDLASAIKAKLSKSELRAYNKGKPITFKNYNKLNDAYFFGFHKSFFNPRKGTYDLAIGGNIVSVFFSGMLSGQRALDLGSYQRLKWHMKAVKDGKEMK